MVFAEIPLQSPPTLTRHSGDSCLFTEAVLCKNCRQMVWLCWCEGWVLTNQRPGMTPGCFRAPGLESIRKMRRNSRPGDAGKTEECVRTQTLTLEVTYGRDT